MTTDREMLFTELFNQKLKERGFTLKQVSELSGISMKYVESFAHGRFENLPPTPYLHGYFVRLGAIMDFDAEDWWQRVRGEDSIISSGKYDRLPPNRYSVRRHRALVGFGILLVVIIAYVGFRASNILGEPQLTVISPGDNVSVTDGHILVAGSVKNADEVMINGEQIPLDNNGFQKDLPLQPGLNTIEVKAGKILGREAVAIRQVYYAASPLDMLRLGLSSTTGSTTATGTKGR